MNENDEERKICGEEWRGMVCDLPPHQSALHRDSKAMNSEHLTIDHRQDNYD